MYLLISCNAIFAKMTAHVLLTGFFLLVGYNKLGIVHYSYLGVSGCNIKKKCIFLSEDLFLPYQTV